MTTRPDPPNPAQCQLWIPASRARGTLFSITACILILAAAAGYLTGRISTVAVILLALSVPIGAIGLANLLRSIPLIAADSRGLFVSISGADRTLIPWNLVGGAYSYRGHGYGFLVILCEDVMVVMPYVSPNLHSHIAERNREQLLPGAIYIAGGMIPQSVDEVASDIRHILGPADRTNHLVERGPRPVPI